MLFVLFNSLIGHQARPCVGLCRIPFIEKMGLSDEFSSYMYDVAYTVANTKQKTSRFGIARAGDAIIKGVIRLQTRMHFLRGYIIRIFI